MGNCHPDGKRLYLWSPEPRFHSESSNQHQHQHHHSEGAGACENIIRRYCSCLRCDFRVSRAGHWHPSIGDVAGSTTQPVSQRNIRAGCVWASHLVDCPLFCAPGSCVPNCLSVARRDRHRRCRQVPAVVTQKNGWALHGEWRNGGMAEWRPKYHYSTYCAFEAHISKTTSVNPGLSSSQRPPHLSSKLRAEPCVLR